MVAEVVRRLLATAILAIVCTGAFSAEWIVEGQVVGVSDGDTITVLDDAKTQHRIRFAGIDAPEKGQAYGEQSKQSLSTLVFQKRVEARCHKRDRYGREVCAVFVGLRDVGLEQIRQGMAGTTRSTSTESSATSAPSSRDLSRSRICHTLAIRSPRSSADALAEVPRVRRARARRYTEERPPYHAAARASARGRGRSAVACS